MNHHPSRLLALLCYLDEHLPDWLAAVMVFAFYGWIFLQFFTHPTP